MRDAEATMLYILGQFTQEMQNLYDVRCEYGHDRGIIQ